MILLRLENSINKTFLPHFPEIYRWIDGVQYTVSQLVYPKVAVKVAPFLFHSFLSVVKAL